MLYRHLLTACYTYYKQLEVLHLFDADPAARPKWTLLHKSDGYYLVTLPSLKAIQFYSHHEVYAYLKAVSKSCTFSPFSSRQVPKILPLIALAAQQKELRAPKSTRSSRHQSEEASRAKMPATRANGSLKTRPVKECAALEKLDLSALESSSRRSSFSIFGTWSPRRLSAVDQPGGSENVVRTGDEMFQMAKFRRAPTSTLLHAEMPDLRGFPVLGRRPTFEAHGDVQGGFEAKAGQKRLHATPGLVRAVGGGELRIGDSQSASDAEIGAPVECARREVFVEKFPPVGHV